MAVSNFEMEEAGGKKSIEQKQQTEAGQRPGEA
jgi:hypothetical protein